MALFHTTVLDNQIKALDTIGTAQGSICTFDTDRAERLVKCVCEVASGASEINVVACGRNLLDSSNKSTNIQYCVFGGVLGSNVPNGSLIAPKGDLVFKSSSDMTVIEVYNKTGTQITSVSYSGTITFNNPTTQPILIALRNYGADWNNITYQLETNTASEYTAYNGTTYNIQFGETLTGNGSFDVLSGILTRSDDTTKQLNANYIQANNGINNVYCDTGNTEVNYIMTVGQAIS